jgi:hypothetical protein
MPAPYILHTMSLVSALDVGNWHHLFPNLGIFIAAKNVLFIGQFREKKMELNLLQFIRSKI